MPDPHLVALVARAKAELPHGLRAFEELTRLQYGRVRSIALAIVGQPDAADTVTQDVMLRMFNALRKLDDNNRFEAWLYRITVNTSRSHLAKERKEREKRDRLANEPARVSVEINDSSAQALSSLLAPLGAEERSVVALKIVEDLEFTDIAAITGSSVSAAKMRYYRALEKLKTNLSASDTPPAEADR